MDTCLWIIHKHQFTMKSSTETLASHPSAVYCIAVSSHPGIYSPLVYLYHFLLYSHVSDHIVCWALLNVWLQSLYSVQFSHSVVSDPATPWTAAHQASLSVTNSRSPPKPMSIESVMPSNHLILFSPSPLLRVTCQFILFRLLPLPPLPCLFPLRSVQSPCY